MSSNMWSRGREAGVSVEQPERAEEQRALAWADGEPLVAEQRAGPRVGPLGVGARLERPPVALVERVAVVGVVVAHRGLSGGCASSAR
jgi:hypothetical protein